MKLSKQKGFTLLEILLVIAAIGILAAIVIVAINPNRQLANVRNVQRQSDIYQLLSAAGQYSIDNNGDFPPSIEALSIGEVQGICAEGVSQVDCQSDGLAYVGELVPDYIAALPQDDQATGNESGYLVYRENEENYGVIAEYSENGALKAVGPYPRGLEAVSKGLIHYYDGEEQAFDRSKGNANMSWIGNESYILGGIGNTNFTNEYAYDFDGSSYLTTGQPNLNSLDTYTIAGWFQANQAISSRTALWGQNDILEVCIWGNGVIGIWHGEDGLYSETYSSDIGVFDAGGWHHFVVTYQNSSPTFYFDGIDVTNVTFIDYYSSFSSNSEPFTIGALSCDGIGNEFTGQIDDVRIYDRILSEEEIQILYEN